MEFLQFLGPLPMITWLFNKVFILIPIYMYTKRNILPSPSKKNPNKNNKSSVIHIFFSYLSIKSLEKSNSRTVGSELPNCRYRSPETSVPKSRTVAYTNSRNVAVPNCRATANCCGFSGVRWAANTQAKQIECVDLFVWENLILARRLDMGTINSFCLDDGVRKILLMWGCH